VTKATADELVQRQPAELIQAKIEVFDWLMKEQDKRVAKSPAGYLVKSITDDYATPKGFTSKAERRRQAEARQAKERDAAEARRRQQQEEAAERAKQQRAAAYWESLTPQQQAELDEASRAQADAETLKLEEPGPFQDVARRLRRERYIRQVLASRETQSAEA
jgi:hypothetical protein